ncbi:MAG TPA: rRNA maturation RNase YbeY [Caulobacteraceae bacterium]|nr:rRNA maturation RNase YbeY [Caulobacteraceae bacterium]
MIEVQIEDGAWTRDLPQAEAVVKRSAEGALNVLHRETGEGDPEGVEGACQPHAPSVASRHLPRYTVEDESISILLTDDDALADLNARFLGKPKPTNVLSFPAPANPEGHLGDIALAYGVCAREASEQGKTLAQHLSHLTVHGVLHLLGYDHLSDGEAEVMEALERTVLEALGVPDPYAVERH